MDTFERCGATARDDGRMVALNAAGWITVALDRTIDTIAHVRRADLGHL